jgi:hypothetical protein
LSNETIVIRNILPGDILRINFYTPYKIYVKDGLHFPNESLKDGNYSDYYHLSKLIVYLRRRMTSDIEKKSHGRSFNGNIFIKKINDGTIYTCSKQFLCNAINTPLKHLSRHYDKPRGHKGLLISKNENSNVFKNLALPKYAHYTKPSFDKTLFGLNKKSE